jgi:hypothetical protein
MRLSKNYYPVKTKLQGSQKNGAIAILKRHPEFPRCLKLHNAVEKRCSMAGCVTALLTFSWLRVGTQIRCQTAMFLKRTQS